jgi:protein TonB
MDTFKKVQSRKLHDDKVTCVEFETEPKSAREVCVNQGTGAIFRAASFEDRDFQPFGSKVFPRSLSFVEHGKKVVKISVTDLTTPGQFLADAFTPPTGVPAEAGCMNPTPARPLRKVNPGYPSDARQQRIQGTVAVDLWIGADGVPIIRQVLVSPSASLEKSTEAAITAWRYRPATCNGKPVRAETVVQMNYTLVGD